MKQQQPTAAKGRRQPDEARRNPAMEEKEETYAEGEDDLDEDDEDEDDDDDEE